MTLDVSKSSNTHSLSSSSSSLFRFLRELRRLRTAADYESCDPTHLESWMKAVGGDVAQYSYLMLKAGVDKAILRYLTEEHLRHDCVITNGIHRMKILEAAKSRSKWKIGRISPTRHSQILPLKPIFYWKWVKVGYPTRKNLHKKKEMYMANARNLRLGPNATYIPLTHVR